MCPVRIRLARHGRHKDPIYWLVVADSRSPRDGRFIEHVGTYNPKAVHGVKYTQLDVQRIRYWVSVGAQPSERVAKLLGLAGVMPPAPIRVGGGGGGQQASAPKSAPVETEKRGLATLSAPPRTDADE
eukprot:ctg_628.g152